MERVETVGTIIIGAGVAGLATAHALASRGITDVLVLEAEPAAARHASGLNAAILRTVIEEPALAALAERSAPFFEDPPEAVSDRPLVDPVGLILTADSDPAAATLEASARQTSRPTRAIDAGELLRRAPFVATRPRAALLSEADGVLDIAALTSGLERAARAAGVRFVFRSKVESLLVERGAVCGVACSAGRRYRADSVLIAAGGWAAQLARPHGSPVLLEPRRRHLLVTAPDPRVEPRWPVVWNLGDSYYARPESGGMLLCACDETVVDPDACAIDPGVRELLAEKVQRHLPRFADAPAAHLWCGMRTFSEDHGFVLGPDPVIDGLFWAAGLGGHGMTTAPAVGQLVACALLDSAAPGDLSPFLPARLGVGC